MSRLHSHPLEFVALFLALGSVAYAAHIAPKNSVGSNSIRNGTITETKLASNAVTGLNVADGSLSTQDLTPSALRDHSVGRSSEVSGCDPPGGPTCASVTLSLSAPARVFLLADGTPVPSLADGACQLTADGAGLSYGNDSIDGQAQDSFQLTDVTGVLAAGSHTFTMICSETLPDFKVEDTHLSAVTLRAN